MERTAYGQRSTLKSYPHDEDDSTGGGCTIPTIEYGGTADVWPDCCTSDVSHSLCRKRIRMPSERDTHETSIQVIGVLARTV